MFSALKSNHDIDNGRDQIISGLKRGYIASEIISWKPENDTKTVSS